MLRHLLPQLLRFLASTAAGLGVDLGGYALLVAAGLPAAAANLVSASASVTLVYLLTSRFVFRGHRSTGAFIAFAAWYAVSIAGFSYAVQWGVDALGLPPLLAKLCSLPFSFAVNFVAVRGIFALSARRATRKSVPPPRNLAPRRI